MEPVSPASAGVPERPRAYHIARSELSVLLPTALLVELMGVAVVLAAAWSHVLLRQLILGALGILAVGLGSVMLAYLVTAQVTVTESELAYSYLGRRQVVRESNVLEWETSARWRTFPHFTFELRAPADGRVVVPALFDLDGEAALWLNALPFAPRPE